VTSVKGPDKKEEIIERMITLYQLPLLRMCILYLHDEHLAKDAVQETFIKAYRNLDHFHSEASEKTWLTRIAINTCKDMYRSSWFKHIDRSVTMEHLLQQPAPQSQPDIDLTAEIMRLPLKMREVALLCWLQDMTQEEAADMLGVTRQAVGNRLNRARRKLRFAIERSDEHDPE